MKNEEITELTVINLIQKAQKERNEKALVEALELLKTINRGTYLRILLEGQNDEYIQIYSIKHLEEEMKISAVYEEFMKEMEEKKKAKEEELSLITQYHEKSVIKSIKNMLPIEIDSEEVKRKKIDDFANDFKSIKTEIEIANLDFFKIMEKVGELPDSIKDKITLK